MMDRRLLVFFASVAILVGAAGYLLAQSRTATIDVEAAPVTMLPPLDESTPTTQDPESETTIRSTLPPTPSGEIFQYAAGEGCTPGGNRLPDGIYYGGVVVNDDRSITFNLKCLFVAADLPEDFSELFANRFPDEQLSADGFDLVDVAVTDRQVRFAWDGQMTFGDRLYVGDEAYVGFVNREELPFDASIEIVDGIATTVVELEPGVSPS